MRMFIEPHLTYRRWEMTENEFRREIQDAYSRVGAYDICKHLNIEMSKEPIQARAGDVILNATCSNGNLRYYYIEITENTKEKPFKTDDVEEVLF